MSTSSGGSEGACSSKMSRASRSLYKFAGLNDYQCAYCSNTDVLLNLCGNCRSVAYCSKECQQLDWQRHKKPCKMKNPTHFQPKYREKVRWFTQIADDELTGYLVDAFRLRCVDEQQMCNVLPKPDEISTKFLRFLHAAKGARLLPASFKKLDFMATRNEALYRYKLTDIAEGKGLNFTQTYGDLLEAVDDLRALHTVICGPVLTADQHPNLI